MDSLSSDTKSGEEEGYHTDSTDSEEERGKEEGGGDKRTVNKQESLTLKGRRKTSATTQSPEVTTTHPVSARMTAAEVAATAPRYYTLPTEFNPMIYATTDSAPSHVPARHSGNAHHNNIISPSYPYNLQQQSYNMQPQLYGTRYASPPFKDSLPYSPPPPNAHQAVVVDQHSKQSTKAVSTTNPLEDWDNNVVVESTIHTNNEETNKRAASWRVTKQTKKSKTEREIELYGTLIIKAMKEAFGAAGDQTENTEIAQALSELNANLLKIETKVDKLSKQVVEGFAEVKQLILSKNKENNNE